MGTLYIAIPGAGSADITEVATTAALKTLLQVATPAGTDIRIHGWGISFDGISATAEPGKVVLVDTAGAATVTSLTPDKFESDDAPASLCVGGVAATGSNASAEGTPGASRILDGQDVHPQTGYGVWFAEARHPRVKPSRFLRVRCTFAVTVNAVPWVVYEEPA